MTNRENQALLQTKPIGIKFTKIGKWNFHVRTELRIFTTIFLINSSQTNIGNWRFDIRNKLRIFTIHLLKGQKIAVSKQNRQSVFNSCANKTFLGFLSDFESWLLLKKLTLLCVRILWEFQYYFLKEFRFLLKYGTYNSIICPQ